MKGLVLLLVLVCGTVVAQSSDDKFRQLVKSAHKNPVIHFTSSDSYHKLVSDPGRNYSFFVLFTATASKYKCGPCGALSDEFSKFGASYAAHFGDYAHNSQFLAQPFFLAQVEPDHCMDVFQGIPTCRVDPLLGAKVNVIGTLNVFEAARKQREDKKKLPAIVYASSAAVTGNPKDYGTETILDNTPHSPLNHYGVFKIANEGAARVYWHDHKIPSVGLRPFTVYGVGREVGLTSAPTKAIKAAILGRPYNIPFTGDLCINYAEDLARVFIQCARAKLDGHHALNIKGEVISINDWIKQLESIVPSAVGTITSSGGPLPFPVHFDEAGLSKLLNEAPVRITPVAEGIRRTVARFKQLNQQGALNTSDLQ